jgi:hypothetical protein
VKMGFRSVVELYEGDLGVSFVKLTEYLVQ